MTLPGDVYVNAENNEKMGVAYEVIAFRVNQEGCIRGAVI